MKIIDNHKKSNKTLEKEFTRTTVFLHPDKRKQLKQVAVKYDITIKDLLTAAIEKVLEKYPL